MSSRNITKPDKASAFFCTGCGMEATGNATDVRLVYLFACFLILYCDMKYLLYLVMSLILFVLTIAHVKSAAHRNVSSVI